MNTRLVIDEAGRVVIPKPLREELQLEPGDALEMESTGEQITLRPVRGTGPLVKEYGVWVFHSGHPLPASATDDMLRLIRKERGPANLGQRRMKAFFEYAGARAGFLRRSRPPSGECRALHPIRQIHRLLWGT